MYQEWIYKGHFCQIERDIEDDCIKHFHYVTLPEGRKLFADITPYDSSKLTVNMWIDKGYPQRKGVGPLHREDLT